MTTIEDKMKLFTKIINDRINEEKQSDFKKFELEKKEIIEKKNKELEEKRKVILKEASKKAQLKNNEIISQEKLKNQSSMLGLKKEFLNNTMTDVRQKLVEFVQGAEYKNFLIELTKKVVLSIEYGSYVLYMSEKDKANYGDILEKELQNYDGKNFTIISTKEDIIGGVIAESKSGKFRVNASLAAKLMECIEFAGVKISEKIG